MHNVSYIRKKVPMSDFHLDGNDFTVMAFGVGFAIWDQVPQYSLLFGAPFNIPSSELLEVCIKASVGAVVGLTVKALFECVISWVKMKINKKQ